jgi:hypothetical protein
MNKRRVSESVLLYLASTFVFAELLIEQAIIGFSAYLGAANGMFQRETLFVSYLSILFLLSIVYLTGNKSIAVVIPVLMYIAYMVNALYYWFNGYDMLRLDAYIIFAAIVIVSNVKKFKYRDEIVVALGLLPGILMLASVIYKFFAAYLYLYLDESVWTIICDVLQVCSLAMASLCYFGSSKQAIMQRQKSGGKVKAML